jgi:tetraacyldisaccharide 4'-kinase
MILREALFPFSLAYQGAMGVRNWMYDKGFRKTQKVKAKVISIGNLTVGGTGKTPMTMFLVEQLQKRHLKCGVISRGYKRAEKGVLTVTTDPLAAHSYGDEPALIKSIFPELPVLVGERRVNAAEALLGEHKVDVIVCDDAFQHRSLHRDFNILLMDVTEPVKNYRVVPLGRARESLGPALKRADVVILTKANHATPEQYEEFTAWLKNRCDKPMIRADYLLQGFHSLLGQKNEELLDPVILISGIAKPSALIKTLEGKAKILKHKSFPDHHRYTDLEVEVIMDEASQLQARWILTTAKDAMKLRQFKRLRERLWIVDLGLKLSGDTKDLYETLDRFSR